MDSILSRLLLSLALFGLGLLAYLAYTRGVVHRVRRQRLGLENARPGVPAILYFTTPDCGPCRTSQTPAIEQLANAHGRSLQVIQVDAQARPDVADQWGVLSVPSTFVIDRNGEPRFFNAGLARAEKLEQQLIQAGLRVNG